MNAEQVVEKILSQANAEADAILNEAKDKAAQQKTALDTDLAEFDKKTEQLAKDAGEDKLQRMMAGARMANAKGLLAARVEVLDDVFAQAKKAVNEMGDDAYLKLMMDLMKKAVETGDEEVIVGKDEARINADFVQQANRELGSGFKGNLRLSENRANIAGGFILSRGKVQINASTDVLIDRLRESLEIELSKELFAD